MDGDAVQTQEPHWYCESRDGTEAMKHVIHCVICRGKKPIKNAINYERVQGVTQEE